MGSMKDLFGDSPVFLPRVPDQITRTTDPSTSFSAASSVIANLKEIQQEVYHVLSSYPDGLTDYELEEKCGSHGATYRTRRAELVELGLVINTGLKKKILGHNRIIWRLK